MNRRKEVGKVKRGDKLLTDMSGCVCQDANSQFAPVSLLRPPTTSTRQPRLSDGERQTQQRSLNSPQWRNRNQQCSLAVLAFGYVATFVQADGFGPTLKRVLLSKSGAEREGMNHLGSHPLVAVLNLLADKSHKCFFVWRGAAKILPFGVVGQS